MKNITGTIDYDLFTIRGNYLVHVDYDLMFNGDQIMVSSLMVSGDGDKPDELETPEIKKEIITLCILDAKNHEKPKKPWEEYKQLYGDWCAN